jgi:hypothetical protein
MSSNKSCAECDRPIKSDTARLCIICSAPSHSICVEKSKRVNQHGQYYCPEHEKNFASEKRKEHQKKILLDRHSALRKNLLMSDESDDPADEEIEKIKSGSENNQETGKERKKKITENDDEEESVDEFGCGLSSILKESKNAEKSQKTPQRFSLYRYSAKKETPHNPFVNVDRRKAVTENPNTANVAHRCGKCKLQMKVPLTDFQRCLVCYEPYHKLCLGVDAMTSNVNFFTCDGCKRDQENVRLKREKENELKRKKIIAEKIEKQKEITNEFRDDEFLWYVTNKDKFEIMKEKYEYSFFQQEPPKRSQQKITSSSHEKKHSKKIVENLASQTPFNASTVMEQIMLEMCRNQANALQRQAEIDERERMRVLPLVKSLGAEWITFFKAYQGSKDFFEHQENVVRLQAAILCPEILKKGGTNLFCTETYDETIGEINKTMNNSKRLVSDGAEKLRKLKSPKDHIHDQKVLIDFIIEIRHFANLLQKVGDIGSQNDSRLIATFASRLTWNLRASWQEKCYAKEVLGEAITVKFLSDFLQQKLGGLERAQTEHNMILWQEEKHSTRPPIRDTRQEKFFSHQQPEKKAWEFRCWIDKSDDHNIKDCPKSKTMSGKKCFELAKQLRVCAGCGKEKFTGKCSRTSPPPPCLQHPGQNHWRTVCPSRPAISSLNNQNFSDTNSQNDENTEEGRNLENEEAQMNSHQAATSRVIDPRFFMNLPVSQFNTTKFLVPDITSPR